MSEEATEKSVEELAEEIEDRVVEGELSAARELLEAGLDAHPDAVELLLIETELTLDDEEYERVLELCDDQFARDDLDAFDLARFEMLAGYAHYYLDDLDTARVTFNDSVRHDALLWNAILGRAMVHEHMGFDTASTLDLERAIELDDEEAEPFAIRGMIRLRQGLHEEAARDFGYALDADPWDEESRLNLARLRADAPSEALEVLEPLVDKGADPDFVMPGALLRSQLSLQLGSTEAAADDARKAIELRPDEPWGYLQLAACHLTAMNAGEAIASLKKAEERVDDPRDLPDLFALRASAYEQLDKPERAREERDRTEGMARLPGVVYGPHLNPAAHIPINPNKPIDVRALLDDLFGSAAEAPEGYEQVLRNIIDQLPQIVEQNPGVGQLHIQLPDAPGMIQPNRQLVIQVNQPGQQQQQA